MSLLSLLPEDKDKKKDIRKESLESVYSSNSRLNLLTKRKRLNPLEMSQGSGSKGDKFVTQRVLSAKAHRVKQLQNQLADAHYHLQELSNENRVLRALQKKQEIALQRYENSNAELPTVLHSHNEEIRIQQSKFKQLKSQYKEAVQKLKERDMQLQMLKDEHQHLLELSKDRNLMEREKLQAQVTDLSSKAQQQSETISMLQRRIALEAKNFRYQLQSEINKHKDTRHDLDLAISNADKMSSIIEMKEKMMNISSSRLVKSPVKTANTTAPPKPAIRSSKIIEATNHRQVEERSPVDNMSRMCESSRNLASALSHDEDGSSSAEPRSRYVRSRNSNSSRSTPSGTRKNSKSSEEMTVELAKTVQNGMADLAIFDDEVDYKNASPEEYQRRIEEMKNDLLKKIRSEDTPPPPTATTMTSRKSSAVRRQSTEESIEENIQGEEVERPKSRGRRGSSVSFYEGVNIDERTTTVAINDYRNGQGDEGQQGKLKRENSGIDKKGDNKPPPIDKYCNDLIKDIEKSTKVIDKHVMRFNHTKYESAKLVEQLQNVDKLNEFVNANGEIPEEALNELNNNFKMLTDQVVEGPIARKRSLTGRRGSTKSESRNNLLGDSNMSNQDMLDDLLGRK